MGIIILPIPKSHNYKQKKCIYAFERRIFINNPPQKIKIYKKKIERK